jgi:formylglycine-generating enzyme required for sulfatase activity
MSQRLAVLLLLNVLAGCPITPEDLEAWSAIEGMDFVLIRGRIFDIGCTPGQSWCDGDEVPVMPVTLTYDYYMSRTEVTQGQFRALMGYNPSSDTDCGGSCPVEYVSWHEAAAFANAVSAAAGLPQCYSCSGSGTSVLCDASVEPSYCSGYRLPTEAEWEGAARCGKDLRYAGSDSLNRVAWYDENSSLFTHPVAEKAANACGLYDMSGNVWEWTQDWYDHNYYLSAGRTDPAGPASGRDRVLRGGSYGSDTRSATVAQRGASGVEGWIDIGFRLVRTVR